MRTGLVAVLCALLGGAAGAGVTVLLDEDEGGGGETRTVVRQTPLENPRAGGDGDSLTAAEIYERDAPGVVFIRAEVVRQAAPSIFDIEPQVERGESTGTGFVISGEGEILTNAHVVQDARRVEVQFEDEEVREAEIVGADVSTDLALLRVEGGGDGLRPLALGSSADLKVGDPTVAIGNPFGLERTLTTGVISALQRRIQAPDGFEIEDVIQTDAALNPGNSGGPLIDAAGRVIGVNSAIRTGGDGTAGGGNIGIGFAVPIDTAKRIVPQLRDQGRVDRPYLGVETATTEQGAVVQTLLPASPAEAAGIVLGDVIVEVDGEKVQTSEDVGAAVADGKVGDTVQVRVARGGEEQTLEVELGRRPNAVAGG